MPVLMNPEEVFGDVTKKPLDLDVRCARCLVETSITVPWVMVDEAAFDHLKTPRAPRDGDEGIVLGHLFTCPSCGALDEYTLTGNSHFVLSAELSRGLAEEGASRVRLGVAYLWDGTVLHRPSQGLSRLRELTAEQPDNAEAWRRLGNFCDRFGLPEEARSAWRTAVERGPSELDAALKLADVLGREGEPDALMYMVKALERLPRASHLTPEQRREAAELLAEMIWELLDQTDIPLGLRAAFTLDALPRGKGAAILQVSDVDLRVVQNRNGLALFLAFPHLVSIGVTRAPDTSDESLLLALIERLGGGAGVLDRLAVASEPIRVPPRTGRNEQCPCGSGKKYKRCHGG